MRKMTPQEYVTEMVDTLRKMSEKHGEPGRYTINTVQIVKGHKEGLEMEVKHNSFCVDGGRFIDMPFNACFTVNPCKGCQYWDYEKEGCGIKPEIKKTA